LIDPSAGKDVAAGSVSVFIEVLHDDEITSQLPVCPDWPDLN
jgi:hypothetical protein